MNTDTQRTNKRLTRAAVALAAAAALFEVSCAGGPTEQGALAGGALGGLIGGIAGDDAGDVATGVAIGALAGAVTGNAMKHEQEKYDSPSYGRNDEAIHRDPRYGDPRYGYGGDNAVVEPVNPRRESPRPPQQARPQNEKAPIHPVAKKTGHPTRVVSPHAPYNLVDVEGFRSGDLAIDPTTNKIFRIP